MDENLERVLIHRVRAHMAALAAATYLGHPAILSPLVIETGHRLAEVRAILDELEREP